MGLRSRTFRCGLCSIGLLLGVVGVGGQRADASVSTGACCPESGACVVTDSFSCEQGGGIYFGDSTNCAQVPCNQQAAVPVFSLLGLVGVSGALAGLGLFRLVRRPREA